MNLLYVEDNPVDVDLLRRSLHRQVPESALAVASTVQAAVEHLTAEAPYDLVLADLRLPDGSGLDVLAHIRERRLPIAVIILTGFGDEAAMVAALKAGADDYLIKQTDYLERLPQTLTAALARARVMAARRAQPLRVLYVDCNPGDCDLVRQHFVQQAPHINLEFVSSTQEALARLPSSRLEAGAYDVVLLEYQPPGLDTLELAKRLRQEWGLKLPLVLLTAQGSEEVAVQALRLGVDDYLTQHPGYLFELVAVLEKVHHQAELVREQKALQEREAQIRLLLESTSEAILGVDQDGRCMFVNRACLQLLGYREAAEVVGSPVQTLLYYPQSDHLPCKEDAGRIEAAYRHGSEIHVDQAVFWRRDRSFFPVEYWAHPIDHDGRVVGAVVTFFDITERQRMEQALRESQTQLQTTVANLDEGVIVSDLNGRLLHWNRAALDMHGFDRLEEGQRELNEFAEWFELAGMDGTVWPVDQWPLARILRGERLHDLEVNTRHLKDHWRRVYSYGGTLVRDASGKPLLAVVAIRDITDRKQAEMALQRTAEELDKRTRELNAILASVQDYVYIFDRDGRFVFANQKLLDLWGRSAEQSIGVTMRDLDYPVAVETILLAGLHWVLESGHVVINETHYTSPTGVDAFYENILSPMYGPDGQVVAVAGSSRDITTRKQAEQALRENEARLRAIVEAVPDMLVVLNSEGRFIEILTTRPQLFCADPATLKGKYLSDVLPAELAQRLLAVTRQTLATGQSQSLDYALPHGRTSKYYLEVRTAPLQEPALDKPGVVLLTRDVTVHRLTEDNLRQAQKMEAVGQLTGGVAHDFNNLLGIILGNLDLLAEKVGSSALQDLVRRSQEAAERGATLVQRLLAFARRQPLEAKPMNLNQLVVGMSDWLQRTLGETIQLETRLAADLPPVVIDSSQFEMALLNLALNARDAMPQGGRLLIETARVWLDKDEVGQPLIPPGAYVRLAISDTGSGMPPEVLERAIEPFFTTKDVSKGSGLGLSMVYGLVKQLEGHIHLYSEVDRGTTVKIYLPPKTLATDSVAARPAAQTPSQIGQGQTILVVEDATALRQLAVKLVRRLGYQTVEAATAVTALQVLEATPQIALLFTDLVLPGGMSGVELAEEAQRRRPDLKVLLTSGYTEQYMGLFQRRQAGMEWLSKPYRQSQLAVKLHGLLETGPLGASS